MAENIKKTKIAIIDDEKELVEGLRTFLEDRNFQVMSAYNGKSGLELIKKEKPDLVILDIMMPDIDGRDVLIELKKHDETKDIPVIMLTVRSEPFDVDYGLELGAQEYIAKPYNARLLLKQINNILAKKRKSKT